MSGIAALIRFDGGPIEPGQIEGMIAAQSHRGPDGVACWSGGSAALGHAMLRTTPESLEETQPLANEDESVVLTMDGRIDNWEELGAELRARGARLRTRADAELVLRAYEAWGQDCVHHMDGDFALVIWDARRRAAFCARDRLGAKPFYYSWDGKCLAIASELHAILALPWVPERLNEGMVLEILSWEQHSRNETLWTGIDQLVAAHMMCATDESIKVWEYWRPNLSKEIRYKTLDEYVEHYRALFFDTVRRQSRSYGPLACEVSGGIDSSAVFAAGEHLRRDGRLLAPGLEGYSLHFGDGSPADEIAYARAVGEHLGQKIHEIAPAFPPLSWYQQWTNRYRDFPQYPNTSMSFPIHETARNAGSRVILTGYGGDEWLMGSRYYYADFLENIQIFNFIKSMMDDSRVFSNRIGVYLGVRYGLFPLLPKYLQILIRGLLRKPEKMKSPNVPILTKENSLILQSRIERSKHLRPTVKKSRHQDSLEMLYSGTRAHNRSSFNFLSSVFGIELRDPLNSWAMVDFHFQTPDYIRQKGNEFRICHRLAMGEMLPEIVRDRDSKAEFSNTIRRKLDDLKGFEPQLRQYASFWLEGGEFERLFERAKDVSSGNGSLWSVWNLLGCALVADDDI